MIDLDSAYNDAVTVQQQKLADAKALKQANIIKHQEYLQKKQTLKNTFNSMKNRINQNNIEVRETYL